MTEAKSIEALRAKLPGMILDLLEENGVSDLPASIEIVARRLTAEQVAEVECAKREVRDGKIATGEQMDAVWRRFGV